MSSPSAIPALLSWRDILTDVPHDGPAIFIYLLLAVCIGLVLRSRGRGRGGGTTKP